MKVSAKMDYAVRALLELGLRWPDTKPCQIQDIGRKAMVPQKFLIHILIALKNLGLVQSVRGQKGGYILGKEPRQIILAGLVRDLGGLGSLEEEKRKKKQDAVSQLWQDMDKSVIQFLKTLTLEDLCNRQRQQIKTLSFDI